MYVFSRENVNFAFDKLKAIKQMTEPEVSKRLITDYYRLHVGEVKAFVLKRMDYSAESEDIVHDIFLKLLESDKIVSAVTLPCLVYTMARNMIYDYLRHRAVVEEYEHYIHKVSGKLGEAGCSSVYSAVDICEILERGMARLSAGQRSIYRMNVVEGMQVSEISECLHENYKSVENRLGIARKMMRTYMRRMLA